MHYVRGRPDETELTKARPERGPLRVLRARATALATTVQPFGTTSARRVYDLRQKLATIQESLQNEHLEAALEAAYGVKLKSKNAANLQAAADKVGKATFALAESNAAGNMSVLDRYLPAESDYK